MTERIADACKTYGMRYLMTSPDHDTPTGRIWEVSTVEDADLYLQLMGDEPLVNPAAFDLILPDTLPEDPCYVAVLTNIMEHPADVIDFSNQKVVTNAEAGDPAHLPQPHPLPERHPRLRVREGHRHPAVQQTGRWHSTTPPPNPSWKKPKRTI